MFYLSLPLIVVDARSVCCVGAVLVYPLNKFAKTIWCVVVCPLKSISQVISPAYDGQARVSYIYKAIIIYCSIRYCDSHSKKKSLVAFTSICPFEHMETAQASSV